MASEIKAPAPSARSAKLCGIWSLIASATCIGIPIGLVLAIIALVKQAKAKRLAKENPDLYERPAATGLVTGIIGLVMPLWILLFLGIIIPELVSDRAPGRDTAARENMVSRIGDLIGQCDKHHESGEAPEHIVLELETYLRQVGANDKNPWEPNAPAYSYDIHVVSGLLSAEQVAAAAEAYATIRGQSVFVIELPEKNHPGFVAGAVRVEHKYKDLNGYDSQVLTKAAAFE